MLLWWIILIVIVAFLVIWAIRQSSAAPARAPAPAPAPANMLLGTWNDEAGFFYNIYSNLNALWAINHFGNHIKPIVLFSGGLYKETRPEYTYQIPSYDPLNWYNHYFIPVNETQKPQEYWERRQPKTCLIKHLRNPEPGGEYVFNRTLLDHIVHMITDRAAAYREMWNKYCKPRQYILDIVQQFKTKHFTPGYHVITVHIRLTDKNPSCGFGPGMKKIKDGSSEDFPQKVTADFVFSLIQREIGARAWGTQVCIFVATDEEKMLQDITKLAGAVGLYVCYTDCIRSQMDTAGFNLDTGLCDKGDFSTPECIAYNQMIDASIHRGHKNLSNYRKGLEAMVDMLLLAEGDLFLRSRGNFSNFPEYLRPDRPTVDMVDEWNALVS